MQFSDLFALDSRQLVAFGVISLVVVVIAFIARRTQGDPGARAVRPPSDAARRDQTE